MFAPLTLRAVLFDLYGTLIDIRTGEKNPRVWAVLSHVLTYLDTRLPPQELSARFFVGAERQQQESPHEYAEIDVTLIFRELLDEAGCHDAGSVSLALAGMLRVLSTEWFQPFPDAIPTLRRLHDHFKLGVVSDAQCAYFRTELTASKIAPLVDAAIASGEYGFRKPDPRLFSIALERLGVHPDQAIYVGNSVDRDMCGALGAGLEAVLLDRTGKHGAGIADSRPYHVVRNLEELCYWLLPESLDHGQVWPSRCPAVTCW